MIWKLCFVLSLLTLLAALGLACSIALGRYRRGRVLTPLNVLFGGLFLAAFVCLIPLSAAQLEQESWRGLKTVAFALHNTFQIFTIDADKGVILESAACESEGLANAYSVYLSITYVVGPLLTFGFLMSFFKNLTAYTRYLLHWFNDVYIFSELNERSISLGADIKKNHRRALIVYTDVFDDSEEAYELREAARELRAVCFKKDIQVIGFGRHSAKRQMVLFVMGRDETENIRQSLRLIEQYKNRERTRLFVFTTRTDGELLLTKADKGKIKLRRVNEVRQLVNNLLYERGSELFKNALPQEDGSKKITAVLLGLGAHGTEMLKALAWYCQMDGYHVEIHAFDIDPKAADRFTAAAPELMSDNYNGVSIPNEAEYTIYIHPGCDITTRSCANEIMQIKDVTYAFVSLGSDEKNISAAAELRMLFERMKRKPVIQAVVHSSEEKRAMTGITNYRGQPYDIELIGDTDASYSEDVILNSRLEAEALARHLKWSDSEDEFWQYEYNYNSSVASALHMKARIACGIPGADKEEDELTPEETQIISALEHRRWNAYMRSEGYIYSGSPDKRTRNDLAKMHHDLVDYKALSEEEKLKDKRVGSA